MMLSKFNVINRLFPRDTRRRKFFKNIYYALHTFLSRLSISTKDSIAGMKSLRSRLKDKNSRPVIVFDHNLGGGSKIYRDGIVRSKIALGQDVIIIIYSYKEKCYLIKHNEKTRIILAKSREQDLYDFLGTLDISEIIVNSLVSFPNPENVLKCILAMNSSVKHPITLPLHDYYMICPSYDLINFEYKYCGLPGIDECENCIRATNLEEVLYKPESMRGWRSAWQEVLKIATEITVFSHYSESLLLKAFHETDNSIIAYKPHRVDYIQKVKAVKKDGKTRIGIPGNVNLAKGSGILQQMLAAIDSKGIDNIEIIVVGNILDNYCNNSHLTVTGSYRKENFHKIIASRGITIIFIPSIWPETFSFTTEEAMMTGLPVAAFNIGAPAERLATYPKALLIDEIDGETALEKIIEYLEKGQSPS